MRYRKKTHKSNPQYIYWTQSRIVKDALAKGWRVVVRKMGKRHLIRQFK
jgi:hypothetical protein